ncbi:hypothetical protein DB31_4073 [Hyalangium minutum]|uniref:Uncharacterized protein n=2 Tax=Hyalangium minutum TaxID=394096 RepID=A0A085W3V0_9BACT|nr:hypothetical protein DB31_4073 [Hyalangium minutum]
MLKDVSMKRTTSLLLGLTLSFSSLAAFAGQPAAKPAAEKSTTEKKAAKPAKSTKSTKASPKKDAASAADQGNAPAN